MTVRNIPTWPTISLKLLQPTLIDRVCKQLINEPETPAAIKHFTKTCFPSHSLVLGAQWGTTDLKTFLHMKTREHQAVSKGCEPSEASLYELT